jgi:hypothetical protein
LRPPAPDTTLARLMPARPARTHERIPSGIAYRDIVDLDGRVKNTRHPTPRSKRMENGITAN